MHVRQRHFGGRNQIQIPVARNLEQVGLELREIAGPGQRRLVGEKGRRHFRVPVRARVQVEHEVDQRPLETRGGAGQHREPRTGDLRSSLEVDDAERRTEVPVRLRYEPEIARRAMSSDLDVVGAALAGGHTLMWQVRDRQQPAIAPQLDVLELHAQLFDLLGSRAARLLNLRRVESLPFGARHFVARGVLLTLQSFDLRQQPPPLCLERRERPPARSRDRHLVSAEPLRTASRLSRRKAGSSMPPIVPAIR